MIIDSHTHAFPDQLAPKAMEQLIEKSNSEAFLNGTIGDLQNSMDKAGIKKSIICSIATKPKQFFPILDWSRNIRCDRIEPFLSFHPDDSNVNEKIRIISEEGFKGIKLHPYYQNYVINEPRIMKIYEEIQKYNLILLSHCGFDIAFPRKRIADPEKTAGIIKEFPGFKLILAHFGGWQDWDEVEKHLLGKDVFMDTACLHHLGNAGKVKFLLENHPADYILFGTDSPWAGQIQFLDYIYSLDLNKDLEDKMFYKNAENFIFK